MKLYLSIFLAASSLPLGFLAAFATLKSGFNPNLPTLLGSAAVVVSATLIIAFLLLLWSIPSTKKRLKSLSSSSN